MSSLGSVAKGLALFVGKQPEEEQRGRGFLGLEWAERVETGRQEVEISRVLAGSPAAGGGLQSGDRILQINRRAIEGIKGARAALATAQPGDMVRILVRRGSGTSQRELELELTVGEGL
jgi:S1-C subfamily serine protease